MKLLIAIPTLTAFYNYPTYFLIGIISLFVIAQVIVEVINLKPVTENNNEAYKEIKSLFKEYDNITSEDIYLDDKKKEVYIDIKCTPLNFSNWSYRDLQAIAKSLGISGRNRKRVILEKEILNFCN